MLMNTNKRGINIYPGTNNKRDIDLSRNDLIFMNYAGLLVASPRRRLPKWCNCSATGFGCLAKPRLDCHLCSAKMCFCKLRRGRTQEQLTTWKPEDVFPAGPRHHSQHAHAWVTCTKRVRMAVQSIVPNQVWIL
jgi:hypothetical protein